MARSRGLGDVYKRQQYDSSYLYYVDGVGLIKKQKIIRDTITETSNLLRYNTILRPY
jgi:hypothetical protein